MSIIEEEFDMKSGYTYYKMLELELFDKARRFLR